MEVRGLPNGLRQSEPLLRIIQMRFIRSFATSFWVDEGIRRSNAFEAQYALERFRQETVPVWRTQTCCSSRLHPLSLRSMRFRPIQLLETAGLEYSLVL